MPELDAIVCADEIVRTVVFETAIDGFAPKIRFAPDSPLGRWIRTIGTA